MLQRYRRKAKAVADQEVERAARDAVLGKGPRFSDLESFVKGYMTAMSELEQLIERHQVAAIKAVGDTRDHIVPRTIAGVLRLLEDFRRVKEREYGTTR